MKTKPGGGHERGVQSLSLSLRSPQSAPNPLLALFRLWLLPHYKEKVLLWMSSEDEEPRGLGGARRTRSACLSRWTVGPPCLKGKTPRSSRPES